MWRLPGVLLLSCLYPGWIWALDTTPSTSSSAPCHVLQDMPLHPFPWIRGSRSRARVSCLNHHSRLMISVACAFWAHAVGCFKPLTGIVNPHTNPRRQLHYFFYVTEEMIPTIRQAEGSGRIGFWAGKQHCLRPGTSSELPSRFQRILPSSNKQTLFQVWSPKELHEGERWLWLKGGLSPQLYPSP